MNEKDGLKFLQWALPKLGYKWTGFRKPRSQVLKRVRERMEELNLSGGYEEYRSYLKENEEEWGKLDSLCYVTISKFFRDRKLWDFMGGEILPEYLTRENREIPFKAWSAGCCNGEEPYTIAIIANQLLDKDSDSDNIKILASDREEEVLKRAQDGIYPTGALKEVKEDELDDYFLKVNSNDTDKYKIKEKLKDPVEFEKRNIRESLPQKKFDMVLCRNLVFTYFKEKEAESFLRKLKPMLNPSGYLIIGSNEQLPDMDWLTQVASAHPVYKKHE